MVFLAPYWTQSVYVFGPQMPLIKEFCFGPESKNKREQLMDLATTAMNTIVRCLALTLTLRIYSFENSVGNHKVLNTS